MDAQTNIITIGERSYTVLEQDQMPSNMVSTENEKVQGAAHIAAASFFLYASTNDIFEAKGRRNRFPMADRKRIDIWAGKILRTS